MEMRKVRGFNIGVVLLMILLEECVNPRVIISKGYASLIITVPPFVEPKASPVEIVRDFVNDVSAQGIVN
ncbi:hypothetical protein G4B88_004795 [Cannabis sativa]|uniref:Uncharacterized protein n=1 Tax=Cannabis sativa TaxID=3483 RepID=A0A7J6FWC8_CANSA|nr:hypothetical protein G4B88_004795 [Cannabis sativa]